MNTGKRTLPPSDTRFIMALRCWVLECEKRAILKYFADPKTATAAISILQGAAGALDQMTVSAAAGVDPCDPWLYQCDNGDCVLEPGDCMPPESGTSGTTLTSL